MTRAKKPIEAESVPPVVPTAPVPIIQQGVLVGNNSKSFGPYERRKTVQWSGLFFGVFACFLGMLVNALPSMTAAGGKWAAGALLFGPILIWLYQWACDNRNKVTHT